MLKIICMYTSIDTYVIWICKQHLFRVFPDFIYINFLSVPVLYKKIKINQNIALDKHKNKNNKNKNK